MGNELPCCLLGRSKTAQPPVARPVLRHRSAKAPKAPVRLPSELANNQLLQPRRKEAAFTPHLILKLLKVDLMRTAFNLAENQLITSRTFFVTSRIEENRRQELVDEEIAETTVPAPKYELLKVTNLPAAKQQDLAWVLAEYKGERERLDGFLEVKKINRLGVARPRFVIFSTEAMYVCDAKNLRAVKRRIKWEDLACVRLAPDDRSVKVDVKNSASSCVLRSPQAPDITNAIKTLYHLKFNEFPQVVLAVSQAELTNPVAEETMEKQQSGAEALLRKYGVQHEKVLRCTVAGTLSSRSARTKAVFMISTRALYQADTDYQLHSVVLLDQLKFIALVSDLSQALFQSVVGDYWIIHQQVRAMVEEVEKTYLKTVGKMLHAQTMTLSQALEIYTPRVREVPEPVSTVKRDSQYYTLGDQG